MSSNATLSVKEKLAYGLGDCGANFVFQTQITFLLFFYTDVFGIPAGAAGTLLLISRILDAFCDPVVGALADRTKSRWGRYRPWVLFSAVPLAMALVLCYTTPAHLSVGGRIAWAALTYNLLMIIYAANNIPYSALSGVMTDDSSQRTSLAAWRFLGAMAAALAVNMFTLDLVNSLGRGELALGYQRTMGLWGVLAIVCFAVTFAFTKERISPSPRQSATLRQDLTALFHSGPWLALFTLAVLIYVQLAFRGGAMLFYFTHYLQREGLFGLFNGIGLSATMVGVFMSQPLAARFGKRRTFQWCLLLSAAFMAAIAVLPSDAIGALFGLQILMQLAFGPTIPLLWTMMADVADYSDWQTGRRSTALAFASIVFGLKTGFGIGAWLSGAWLEAVGYTSTNSASSEAVRGIVMLVSVFPAIALMLGFAVLFRYSIDDRMEAEIKRCLRDRRTEIQSAGA
jgi:sugar (glycoside-pentoside-hexuronide) transporter